MDYVNWWVDKRYTVLSVLSKRMHLKNLVIRNKYMHAQIFCYLLDLFIDMSIFRYSFLTHGKLTGLIFLPMQINSFSMFSL